MAERDQNKSVINTINMVIDKLEPKFTLGVMRKWISLVFTTADCSPKQIMKFLSFVRYLSKLHSGAGLLNETSKELPHRQQNPTLGMDNSLK